MTRIEKQALHIQILLFLKAHVYNAKMYAIYFFSIQQGDNS